MDKKSKLKALPPKYLKILAQFFDCYREASGGDESILDLFSILLEEQIKHPFVFEPYHKKVRHPIDYYKFSLDFIRPFIDLPHSKLEGEDVLDTIASQLKKGENVILLGNHQTETDPQAISILLEKTHSFVAEKIIYVAGERVVTDPLAVPFSIGTDLLCIYSKRYIDHPPELKMQKQMHNKKTMELMSTLLKEGGKIIYVAPSGGRDRKNTQGEIEIAPFDPSSVEMFYLMARKAKTPTHFYPLSLATYNVLPPPDTIQKELGEVRKAQRSPIKIVFSPEFNMEKFSGSDENDKTRKRQMRADAIWKIVKNRIS